MARPARRKSPRRRYSDPGQLGLFDAVETRPSVRSVAPAQPPKRPQAGRAKPALPPAPERPPERPVVLSPREAAQYLGVSVSTLKLWRVRKIGPQWTRRGARLIAYRPADLERFLDENSAGG